MKEKHRDLFSKASTNRKTKKFKRADIMRILKNKASFLDSPRHRVLIKKMKQKNMKYNVDVPEDHEDARGKHRTPLESAAWLKEGIEEMETSGAHFRKKLKIEDLRKENPDLQPISGMWVCDAHPEGVKKTPLIELDLLLMGPVTQTKARTSPTTQWASLLMLD